MPADPSLAPIAARHAGASPGPWAVEHPANMSRQPWPGPSLVRAKAGGWPVAHCSGDFADADFIAAAWEDVRWLLAEVGRLQAQNDRLRESTVGMAEAYELAAEVARLAAPAATRFDDRDPAAEGGDVP